MCDEPVVQATYCVKDQLERERPLMEFDDDFGGGGYASISPGCFVCLLE